MKVKWWSCCVQCPYTIHTPKDLFNVCFIHYMQVMFGRGRAFAYVHSFVAFFMLFITFYPCNTTDHVYERGASRRKRRNLFQTIQDTVVGCLIAFNLPIVKMPTIYIHKMYTKTYAAFGVRFFLCNSSPLFALSFSCKHAVLSIEDIHSQICDISLSRN